MGVALKVVGDERNQEVVIILLQQMVEAIVFDLTVSHVTLMHVAHHLIKHGADDDHVVQVVVDEHSTDHASDPCLVEEVIYVADHRVGRVIHIAVQGMVDGVDDDHVARVVAEELNIDRVIIHLPHTEEIVVADRRAGHVIHIHVP